MDLDARPARATCPLPETNRPDRLRVERCDVRARGAR